jgi:hypothetical protein
MLTMDDGERLAVMGNKFLEKVYYRDRDTGGLESREKWLGDKKPSESDGFLMIF